MKVFFWRVEVELGKVVAIVTLSIKLEKMTFEVIRSASWLSNNFSLSHDSRTPYFNMTER